MSNIKLHVLITGLVQGVGFRAWTMRNARELGISGWVRNNTDGSVEAVFSGEKNIVEKFLSFCRKGPARAKVENVTSMITNELVAPGFTQRETSSISRPLM